MKGQIISTDLMVAVLILLVIITGTFFLLDEFTNFQEQKDKNRDIELRGQNAIETLLTHGGDPNDWENTIPPP